MCEKNNFCNICGRNTDYLSTVNLFPSYGSSYDMEDLKLNVCSDCIDSIFDFIEKRRDKSIKDVDEVGELQEPEYELSFQGLQNYIENFKDCKFVYSHENNPNDDFSIQISFDAIVTSKFTNKIMFYMSKFGKNKPDSMFMTLHDVKKITVQPVFPSLSDALRITTKSNNGENKEYCFLFTHHNK